jgi:hypothetical protein
VNIGGNDGRGNGREHNRGNNSGTSTTTASSSASTTRIVATTIPTTTVETSTPILQPTGSMKIYCAALGLSTSGVLFGHVQSDLGRRPGALTQLDKQCGGNGQSNGDQNSGAGSNNRYSDSNATSTASTTPRGSGVRGGKIDIGIHPLDSEL